MAFYIQFMGLSKGKSGNFGVRIIGSRIVAALIITEDIRPTG
jgi:hypothetical protein